MMTPPSAVEGSGGYVAVEHMTGSLKGRRGSFTLLIEGGQHSYEFDYTLPDAP